MNTNTIDKPTNRNLTGEFTEEYFLEEIRRMRENFGNPKWWALPEEKRERCFDGLTVCYLNITNADGSKPTSAQIEFWANTLDSTCTEYERRKLMTTMLALRKDPRPDCPECKRPHGVAKTDGKWHCHMVDHKQPVYCGEVE